MKALIAIAMAAGLAALVLVFGSMYTVNEGHVAVVSEWSKAVRQEKPNGLQFKTPVVVGIQEFDVRERVITGTISAGTSNQLATNIEYSVNWRPDPDQILLIARRYGSPDEFATNVIRTRLGQSLKSVVGKFTGAQLIREREAVASAMLLAAQSSLEGYPAFLESVQIEDLTLPARYMEAVLLKEEQRETTDREQLILEQQKITAQRDVQSAEAARDASIAQADGEAYRIRTEAEAQAAATILKGEADAGALLAKFKARSEGQTAIAKALGSGKLAVEYARSIAWDGQLPVTVMGDQPELLMELPK